MIIENPRLEWLASDANPDADQREAYRLVVERLASGEPMPPPAYPSLATQAANLAGAAVRFVASGGELVDDAEYERRKAGCYSCPTDQHDAQADRCFRCGCMLEYKRRSKAESCPDGHW